MGYPKTQPQTAVSDVGVEPVDRRATRAGLLHCLIVSQHDLRCQRFEKAAVEGGWEPIVRYDADAAAVAAARLRFQLAIIDLQQAAGTAVPAGFCHLAEELANEGSVLLVICGNDGDALQEIWAHQLGTWLYLPGVDDQSDLVMLCSEARSVVEKLQLGSTAKEAGSEGQADESCRAANAQRISS